MSEDAFFDPVARALAAGAANAATLLSHFKSTTALDMDQIVGVPETVALATSLSLSPGTYVFDGPAVADGIITSLECMGGSSGGALAIKTFTFGADSTFQQIGQDRVLGSTTANTLAMFDNLSIPISRGQYVGLYCSASALAYVSGTGTGWVRNTTEGSQRVVANATWNTAAPVQVKARITYPSLNVGPMRVSSLRTSLSRTGTIYAPSHKKLRFIFDGNSLQTRYDGLPHYPALMAAAWNTPFVNYGFSGQTTQQMTADAVSQVDPRAAETDYFNVLIVQEMLNDAANNSLTAAQVVDNMQTYCLARKAAGFDAIGVTTIHKITTPNRNLTSTLLSQINAELRARYQNFCDFIIDFDKYQQFANPADTTYYYDGVHFSSAGHRIAKNAVLNAVLDWLAT